MTRPQFLDLRLVVKRQGLVLSEILLAQDTLSVGRDPDCDIVLDDPAAPRRVAEFIFEEGGLWVSDSGSLWGISVGGEVVDRRRLWPGEEVEMGSFLIELRTGVEASAAVEPTLLGTQLGFQDEQTVVLPRNQPRPTLVLPDGSHVDLEDGTLVLGRGRECDILLTSSEASKRHAELRVHGGAVTLVDLGSTNGSRVNGESVQERSLASGDRLELADEVLQIELPSHAPGGWQTPEGAGNDATVVPGAALQEQIRAEVAAMVQGSNKVGKPPARRRLLLVVAAVVVAIVACLIAILVLARGLRAATVDPAPESTVAAIDSRPARRVTVADRPGGSIHVAWNNGGS